jgi:hypothetical protein
MQKIIQFASHNKFIPDFIKFVRRCWAMARATASPTLKRKEKEDSRAAKKPALWIATCLEMSQIISLINSEMFS